MKRFKWIVNPNHIQRPTSVVTHMTHYTGDKVTLTVFQCDANMTASHLLLSCLLANQCWLLGSRFPLAITSIGGKELVGYLFIDGSAFISREARMKIHLWFSHTHVWTVSTESHSWTRLCYVIKLGKVLKCFLSLINQSKCQKNDPNLVCVPH